MRLLIACILLCGFAVAQDSSAKASLTPESREAMTALAAFFNRHLE